MKKIIQRIIAYSQQQYLTVLIFLAIILGGNYLVVIDKLKEQDGISILLKMSADQSNAVNAVNLLTIAALEASKAEFVDIKSRLSEYRVSLRDTHQLLISGNRFLRKDGRLKSVTSTLPDGLKEIYFDKPVNLDQRMKRYSVVLSKVIKMEFGVLQKENPEFKELNYNISPDLLIALERVFIFHQKRSESLAAQAISLQNLAFLLSIAALIAVGSLLLKPMVENLEKITLHAKSEKAFADNVINTAETLIIGVNAQQNIVLFNRYAEELSGWGGEEARGKNFFQQFIPEQDQSLLKPIFDGMMEGEVEFSEEVETQMIISTGDYLNIIWHTTIVKDSKTDKPVMFLATGLDITERKEAEAKLQKANVEMEALSLRLQSEVNLAATLQRSILPAPIIELPGLQGLASLLTSSEVGGDYYDYFKVGAYTSVVIVGDVSGHGVAAGTIVSAAKAGLFPLIHEGVSDPSEILQSLNETLFSTAHQSLLMTMACVTLDARNGQLKFANAGHVLPYLWRHNEGYWEMLEASGLPLGKSLDADYRTSAIEITMDVGDRLFLFTDAIVEEESPEGEAFGYDRLENILHECSNEEPDFFQEVLLTSLQHHCEVEHFGDDVTMLIVDHSDRVSEQSSVSEVSDIVRLSENFYRQGNHPIPKIPREFIVFLAENEWSDLLPRFAQDGICRVLSKHCAFCKDLGWEHLLNQHHQMLDDDLYSLIPHSPLNREFQITHTDDKAFIMEEIYSWLSDQENISQDHLDTLISALDEMIENSLYAAPRDGKGIPYYEKGIARELSKNEDVRIDIALKDNKLGLMVTDSWGTLSPAVFLKSVANAMEGGVEAGVGGAGLYMMWRMSDYFQIRVYPQKRTQVSTIWDLTQQINMDTGTGFQFLYHSDYDVAYKTEG